MAGLIQNEGGVALLNDLLQLSEYVAAQLGTRNLVRIACRSEAAGQLPGEWKDVDPDELGSSLRGALESGSVLVVPPWEQPRLRRGSIAQGADAGHEFDQWWEAAQPTRETSVLCIVIPTQFLHTGSWRAVRRSLAHRWRVRAILTASGLGGGFNARFSASVVVLSTEAGRGVAWFPVTVEDPNGRPAQRRLQHLIRTNSDSGRGFAVPTEEVSAETWAPEAYDPEIAARAQSLDVLGGRQRLDSVAEVFQGTINIVADQEWVTHERQPESVRLVRATSLRRGQGPSWEDERHRRWVSRDWPNLESATLLIPGDLLVSRVHDTTSRRLRTGIVEAYDLPAIADRGIYVVRFNQDVTRARRALIVAFLESEMVTGVTRHLHSTQLPLDALQSLPVPIPDQLLETAFEELEQAGRLLDAWKVDALEVMGEAFREGDLATARSAIIEGGRLTRMRVNAASLVGDFRHMVLTQYPYPVAYRYRHLTTASTTHELRTTYAKALACAETLIGFLGSLTLSLSEGMPLHQNITSNLRDQMGRAGFSVGLGSWWSVLRNLTTQTIPSGSLLEQVASFASSNEVTNAYARLSERRNNEAHQRQVEEHELAAAIDQSTTDLDVLLAGAQFLVDSHLVHVTNTRVDARRQIYTIDYRELRGDNAVVPSARMETDQGPIETDALYLHGADGRLQLLRPFLTVATCPRCHAQSLFHLDRWQGKEVMLRSLEHGHVMASPDSELILQLLS